MQTANELQEIFFSFEKYTLVVTLPSVYINKSYIDLELMAFF